MKFGRIDLRGFGYTFAKRQGRGIDERIDALRSSSLFNVPYYLSELQKAGGTLEGFTPYEHYELKGDAARLKPHPLFDTHFYHEEYADIEGEGMSALFHFLKHGHREGRNPHPLFQTSYVRDQTRREVNPLASYLAAAPGTLQPHPLFDEQFVLSHIKPRMKDGETVLAAYLRLDRNIDPSPSFICEDYLHWYPDIQNLHPFYHYVRWGLREGRQIANAATSLRGVVTEIEHAAKLDPDLIPPHTDINRLPRISRLAEDLPQTRLLTLLMRDIDPRRSTMVYLVNDLTAGGAERVLANLANAQASDPSVEQILIVATGGKAADARPWLPRDRTVVVDAADEVAAIGDLQLAASVVATALQLFQARAVCVINSALGWSLIEAHGRALRSTMRLAACAFCYDFDIFDRRAGYAWTDLSAAIPHLDVVLTDNQSFATTLRGDLHLSDEDFDKIRVLYQPVAPPATPTSVPSQKLARGEATILWAGRFSRQKRVDVALAIAARMPHTRFLLAGGTRDEADVPDRVVPANVTFLGRFTAFSALPVGTCSALLYTSAWDGLPNVLLEAAAAGLPIVAAGVGGVGELIDATTGWLVTESSDPEAYVAALEAVLRQDEEARRRTRRLAERIRSRHGSAHFAEAVKDLFPIAPVPVTG